MRAGSVLRASLALVLAGGAHVAAFGLVMPQIAGGAQSAGEGGDALISISAASGDLTALVAAWETPPVLAEGPQDLASPDAFDAPPALPEMAPAPRTPVIAALSLPQADTVMQSPGLPPQPAPRPTIAPGAAADPVAEPVADPVADPVAKPAVTPKSKPRSEQPKTAAKPAPKTQAKAKPKAKVAGSAGQKAAGSGQGRAKGTGGTSASATLSKGDAATLTAQWGSAIRARIEKRKRYPAAAKGAGGKVTLRLTVNRNGALAGVSVAKSSGHAALDDAAIKAVRSAGRFAAAPKGLADASYSFTLPISFSR